jgi:hypothetical protein
MPLVTAIASEDNSAEPFVQSKALAPTLFEIRLPTVVVPVNTGDIVVATVIAPLEFVMAILAPAVSVAAEGAPVVPIKS